MRDADRVEIAMAELERVIARARARASAVAVVPSRYFEPTAADRARVGL